MRPIDATSSSSSRPRESSKKKLLTKLHRSTVWPDTSSSKSGHSLHPTSTNLSARTLGTVSSYSTSSDALLDARSEIAPAPSHPTSPRRVVGLDGGTGALGDFAMGSTLRKKRKEAAVASSTNEEHSERYPGPRLRTVYAEFLRYLVAAARAWYAESVPQGEATFVRLWSTSIFVLATPSDWSSAETDLLRQAVEDAKLLPVEFEVGRLVRSARWRPASQGTLVTDYSLLPVLRQGANCDRALCAAIHFRHVVVSGKSSRVPLVWTRRSQTRRKGTLSL